MNTIIRIDGEAYDLADLGIRYNTISFYRTKDDDEAESNFGTCDLTGIRGNVVPCIALDADDEIVEFEVLECIVHGGTDVRGALLGRLAGAF